MSSESVERPQETSAPKRVRRGRKRTNFKNLPRMVYPVRALWEAASEADQKQARQRCVAILELWLGKATKAEVARRLDQPPLRVWQLSQRALSGMLAALVHQPRTRVRKGAVMVENKSEDLKALRKENAQLKRRLKVTEDLIEVLRMLPAQEKKTPAPPKRRTSAGRAGGPRRKAKTSPDKSRATPSDRPGDP